LRKLSMQVWFAALLFCFLAGAGGAALILEYFFHFMPCELCLLERKPYYIGAAVMAVTFLCAYFHAPRKWAAIGFIIVALLMLSDIGLSVYHVGVELKYWPGPTACASMGLRGMPISAENMLGSINNTIVIPCDIPAGYIFGISFAGWNGIAAFCYLIIAALALYLPRKQAR